MANVNRGGKCSASADPWSGDRTSQDPNDAVSGNVVRKAPVLLARRGSSVETSRSSARTLRPPPITRRRRRGLCLPMPFIRAASVLNVGDPPPEEIGEQSRIGPRLDVDPGPPLSAEVSRDARNNVAATGPTNGGFLVTIGQRRPDDAVYRARTGPTEVEGAAKGRCAAHRRSAGCSSTSGEGVTSQAVAEEGGASDRSVLPYRGMLRPTRTLYGDAGAIVRRLRGGTSDPHPPRSG